jgi:2'-5' RNA ligase
VRLFVALETEIGAAFPEIEKIQDSLPGASLVPAKNMHVTLQFIGDVDSGRSEVVAGALEKIRGFGSFDCGISGLGAFPNSRSARVVWLGVESERIFELAEKVRKTLAPLGLVPDKDFRSHITIARLRNPSDISRLVADYSGKKFLRFRAEKIVLKESILSSAGSEYCNVCEVSLDAD